VIVIRIDEFSRPEGVRYTKSHEVRDALAKHERGEDIAPGDTFESLPPRLNMDETEVSPLTTGCGAAIATSARRRAGTRARARGR
jgi:hypothetical protein